MDVLFCHGLESAPKGAKYHALVDAGFSVTAPNCREMKLEARVRLLTDAMIAQPPSVVVGSSYGGLAGLLASIAAAEQGVQLRGLVLCAPALALPNPDSMGTTRRPPAPTIIIHAPADEICPFSASEAFAAEHGAMLVPVDDTHRLSKSLPELVRQTKGLLRTSGQR